MFLFGNISNRRLAKMKNIKHDFPILKQEIHGKPLVYLDSSATSQKPQMVLDAILHYYQNDHSNDAIYIGNGKLGKVEIQGKTNLIVKGEIRGKLWYSNEYNWCQGGSEVRMIHKDKGFCFLTYVSGHFEGGGEAVWVYIKDDYWYLGGQSLQQSVCAKARCVGMP